MTPSSDNRISYGPTSSRAVRRVVIARDDVPLTIEDRPDTLAAERPFEIRLAGESLTVTLRTPGNDLADDIALAAGFVFTEGIIDDPSDLLDIAPCLDERGDPIADTVNVRLAEGGRPGMLEVARERARRFPSSAACGLCGVRTLEEVARAIPPVQVPRDVVIEPRAIRSLLANAAGHQPVFRATGNAHAAILSTRNGAIVDAAEDVGRHNAVDKLIGRHLLRWHGDERNGRKRESGGHGDAVFAGAGEVVLVSGRAGFEIVQKLARANIAIVLAVGAASADAAAFADAHDQTLAGFCRARDGVLNMTVYTHSRRCLAGVV